MDSQRNVAKAQLSLNNLKCDNKNNSEITVKQFLGFLKTAYQVQDNLEGILMAKGMMDVVDWIKVKDGQSKAKSVEVLSLQPQQSDTNISKEDTPKSDLLREKSKTQVAVLQEKLSDIISEGIMDTVLPLLMPSSSTTVTTRKGNTKIIKTSSLDDKLTAGSSNSLHRRRSSTTSIKMVKNDSDVEIHVSDEIKGTKKDFLCNQRLLVQQMGYFADVTKDQKLEDMDISVHCDITIFEWLMNWVKRDDTHHLDDFGRPKLESNNVIPILVSASFLQMEPLIQECLLYCHEHMNDILKVASSMSCLNDSVLSRLAAMYTNIEVENLRDRKDKIQSRLFCKLIQSMCEPEAETLRGHYSSLAKIYRCRYCHQLIHPQYGNDIPCIPTLMSLQFDGSLRNNHVRDPGWDLNEFIISLQKSLKTWRKVYWRLWGCTHFLYCIICKRYFPVKQHGWCRFHPDHPQYFTLDAQKPPLPVGRFPCCGERAYRFQLLDDRSGCYFREHTPSTKDIRDAAISAMLDTYKSLISEEAPKLIFPDRLTRLIAREPTDPDDSKLETKELFWWEGLEIVPARPKLGLLDAVDERHGGGDENENGLEMGDSPFSDEASSDESTTSTSSSTPGSEESMTNAPRKRTQKKKQKKHALRNGKKMTPRLWQHSLSARSNQDLQRNHEEIVFKQMANVLNARTICATNDSCNIVANNGKVTPNKSGNKHGIPQGGVWVRLESEWKEKNAPMNKSKNIYTSKVRMRTSRIL